MIVFRFLFKFLYMVLFGIKPKRYVKLAIEHESDTTEFIIMSVKGFKTTFICQRLTYNVTYENKFLPPESFKIYKLSAAHSEDIPDDLREVLSAVHYLPSFKSFLSSEHETRKILIEAYVDLVTREIEN